MMSRTPTLPRVIKDWGKLRSLLEGPSPAVLTTYRKDASAFTTPVWFHWNDGVFEIVIAKNDVKLRHLARDPRCVLVVFEAVPPFRGIEVRGEAQLREGDVREVRATIAHRYLGPVDGPKFSAKRASTLGVLLSLPAVEPRAWDLAGILPRS